MNYIQWCTKVALAVAEGADLTPRRDEDTARFVMSLAASICKAANLDPTRVLLEARAGQ